MSTNADIVTTVHSFSSGTVGRSLNTIRNHHLVIDSPSLGEEITSGEAFLAGISACGVTLVELAARETGAPLRRIDVAIEGRRTQQDPTWFTRIDVHFTLTGPSPEQAEALVEGWKRR